ncbi:hypothetical protein [Aestuariicoccus sp. MJ-SS9]|nr:hypothetical protein [Aestuariicoccus sp. MJ-SS9]MDU8914202.1 hypothetical protein [Aestuariicoccus sp. MJ-SS9]
MGEVSRTHGRDAAGLGAQWAVTPVLTLSVAATRQAQDTAFHLGLARRF